MRPPGFEPGSPAPKAERITKLPHGPIAYEFRGLRLYIKVLISNRPYAAIDF